MSIYNLEDIQDRVVRINADNGWSDDVPEQGTPEFTHWLITKLALAVTELAEGIEEVRKGRAPDETYYMRVADFTDGRGGIPHDKPEGLPSELADTVIRVIHLCALLGIDLPASIDEKLTFNATRGFRHGGKTA